MKNKKVKPQSTMLKFLALQPKRYLVICNDCRIRLVLSENENVDCCALCKTVNVIKSSYK